MPQGRQGRRLKAIGWLMLAGELLLLLFLGQWLRAQYKGQQGRLDQEVKMTFALTEAHLNDSLFRNTLSFILASNDSAKNLPGGQVAFGHVIPRRGKDTSAFYTISITNDQKTRPHLDPARPMNIQMKSNGATIIRLPNAPAKASISLPLLSAETPEQEVLGQMIRLALSQRKHVDEIRTAADSVLWLKTFQAALSEKQKGLSVHWDTTITTSNKLFHYGADDSLNVPFMVTGYNTILAKGIAPQVAFCLLLALLIGGAFLLAYRTMRQQARFNTQKDSFISNISHELKTPVATTRVALEALTTYEGIEDPERAKKYLNVAHWEMNRLSILIDRIMNVIQVQNGKIQLDTESLQPAALVEELVQTLQPVFTEKKVKVIWTPGNPEATITGDKVHLLGAVYNLLDNALKYGGNEVRISQAIDGNRLRLTVADNGPGIADEYRHKVFESFFRIPSGNRHDVKGHGLGLSYAYDIIRAHGGQLNLDRYAGNGATFVITLPINPTP
ncbi:sensor histidine kinase [Taibaiella koreensis]|uniref:sensor histidine kinase n=1 Tax=Taibaiella koreensis TaxID=1268548 RepID=UPI000E59AEFD|nr:HAMP domain-containing sensor histidine kinase [Taibaiella koreensis]